jgi:hypothetical protein
MPRRQREEFFRSLLERIPIRSDRVKPLYLYDFRATYPDRMIPFDRALL